MAHEFWTLEKLKASEDNNLLPVENTQILLNAIKNCILQTVYYKLYPTNCILQTVY
jgi:hypothetical protein